MSRVVGMPPPVQTAQVGALEKEKRMAEVPLGGPSTSETAIGTVTNTVALGKQIGGEGRAALSLSSGLDMTNTEASDVPLENTGIHKRGK